MKHLLRKQPDFYLSIIATFCLLIFLAISGYQYMMSKKKKEFGMEVSEVKSVVNFFDTRYKQILPVNGQLISDQVISFEWISALDVKTRLIIKNAENGCVVFTQPINSDTKQHRFNKYLGKGKYTWNLEGFNGEKIFVMK